MADSLPDLVARLRAQEPALADVPDDVLTAEVLRQLQARGGPSVGDALGDAGGTPTFRTRNEQTPEGEAVVRAPVSPWTKAATIGAPGIGERYSFPSVGEVLASDSPLQLVAQFVTGHGRPRSVANADPLGVTAFHEGKGPMPMLMGTTEEVKGLLGSVGEEVGAAGRGLYSRVDDAVSLLPKHGAHPNKIAGILKSNASAEELAYRQVPEFLASKGNATVTPGELQAHLAAHPAPMPTVKTLGGAASARPMPEGYRIEPLASGNRPGAQHNYTLIGPDGSGRAFYATDAADAQMMANDMLGLTTKAPTKYAPYQLPGGEAYRETLLTLPQPKVSHDQYLYDETVRELTARHGPNYREHLTNSEINQLDVLGLNQYQDKGTFRSSHFDEPNIVVHTRSNTRTLPTGERGRFVEEVQSDWHQAGKEKGYQDPNPPPVARPDLTGWTVTDEGTANPYTGQRNVVIRDATGQWQGVRAGTRATNEEILAQTADRMQASAQREQQTAGVPDAPFKETWPDLGLKQQLLEAAKDPEAQWLGFTSGETQAARYDLSKQIDELKWYRDGDGYRISARKDGQIVAQQSALSPQELSATVGKEMAEKITANQEQHGVMSGLDLKVGGEGMKHFYDQLLPKRLQKIVKPFGGTVERAPLGGRSVAAIDAEMDAIVANLDATTADSRRYDTLQAERNRAQAGENGAPAWIVRLTPAMKARILKEGLPLGLLLGAAGPSVAEALGGDSNSP